MTKGEIVNELWQKQGILFNKQRETIVYLGQLLSKEYREDYNIRVNDINVILNECIELEKKWKEL
jgi:hypothetical protein